MRAGAGAVPGPARRTQGAQSRPFLPRPRTLRSPVPGAGSSHSPPETVLAQPHPNPRPEGRVPGPPLKLPGAYAGPDPSACLT